MCFGGYFLPSYWRISGFEGRQHNTPMAATLKLFPARLYSACEDGDAKDALLRRSKRALFSAVTI